MCSEDRLMCSGRKTANGWVGVKCATDAQPLSSAEESGKTSAIGAGGKRWDDRCVYVIFPRLVNKR